MYGHIFKTSFYRFDSKVYKYLRKIEEKTAKLREHTKIELMNGWGDVCRQRRGRVKNAQKYVYVFYGWPHSRNVQAV